MDNVIQETIQYTRQRKIFKLPVLYHQTVHFRLAELQTEVELLRSLLYRATGEDPTFQPPYIPSEKPPTTRVCVSTVYMSAHNYPHLHHAYYHQNANGRLKI